MNNDHILDAGLPPEQTLTASLVLTTLEDDLAPQDKDDYTIHVCLPDGDDPDLDIYVLTETHRITVRVDQKGDILWVLNRPQRPTPHGSGLPTLLGVITKFKAMVFPPESP